MNHVRETPISQLKEFSTFRLELDLERGISPARELVELPRTLQNILDRELRVITIISRYGTFPRHGASK